MSPPCRSWPLAINSSSRFRAAAVDSAEPARAAAKSDMPLGAHHRAGRPDILYCQACDDGPLCRARCPLQSSNCQFRVAILSSRKLRHFTAEIVVSPSANDGNDGNHHSHQPHRRGSSKAVVGRPTDGGRHSRQLAYKSQGQPLRKVLSQCGQNPGAANRPVTSVRGRDNQPS